MVDRFVPDFDAECWRCGTSPCVIVVDHEHKADTDLCGPCFFNDGVMIDWSLWNDIPEDTE